MKKKVLIAILATVSVAVVAAGAFGVAGCNIGGSDDSGNSGGNQQTENQGGGEQTQKPDDSQGSGEQTHTHTFDKQVTEVKYLKSEATLTEKAVYYYSCECGEKGTETFEYGEVKQPTQGLKYELNTDGTGYTVMGIGTATDTEDIVIADKYNGKPVTGIGDYAFEACDKLTSITIPDSVTSIGEGAFYECSSLTGITLPDSVTNIGWGAFIYCSGLEKIMVGENNVNYKSIDNCLLTKDGKTLVLGCKKSVIPDSVVLINENAFCGCSTLTNLIIPDSVTSICYQAFAACSNLTNITIPDSVTTIDGYVFCGCSSLTSIIIPDGVTIIDEKTFEGCSSLTSITLPNSVKSIGRGAFEGCTNLTSITIPNSVTSIGDYAFNGCTNLTIYCEVESKPNGWDRYWNNSNLPVVWGYKAESNQ